MQSKALEALDRFAASQPHALAVVDPVSELTYGQLSSASDAVAASLRQLGVPPASIVAIRTRKTCAAVTCILGILKARCCYLPLHLSNGAHRENDIIETARIAALLVDSGLAAAPSYVEGQPYPFAVAAVENDPPFRILPVQSLPQNPSPDVATFSGDPPAVVFFTSGSTGTPKGVLHTAGSIDAFARWAVSEFAITSEDRCASHAPLSFDLTTLDIFGALYAGAAVVLIPESLAIFPHSCVPFLKATKPTMWYSVPNALVEIVSASARDTSALSSLSRVLFAGERIAPTALLAVANALPQARLSNLFGPTETNVCLCHHVTPNDLDDPAYLPIGTPLPYVRAKVRNADTGESARVCEGELLIAGAGLMKGYLTRHTDLGSHEERPFEEGFYPTGDIVRRDASGTYQLVGRTDRQVKHRGIRIELDALEHAITTLSGVNSAAVWIVPGDTRGSGIHAAVELTAESKEDAGSIRARLRPRLPAGWEPYAISLVPKMPRSATGKIDRVAVRATVPDVPGGVG